MSMIYNGDVVETELSKNSKGGTEMMRKRLLDTVQPELLNGFAIHFSRPRDIPEDVLNIMYCHDLAEDPENAILQDGGWKKFDHFVFVTAWQRDQYITYFQIPYSKCSVIPNAIEKRYEAEEKNTETIRFIYHTTPHRGLELLVPAFDALTKEYDNIHLDVYSSFAIYGWPQRDDPYVKLFTEIHNHPKMTYHGSVPNDQVLKALDNSHVFLYPNIWKETSCIALIEAIRSGLICIHPNYGALAETASNATIMYDYTEDPTAHASMAYAVGKSILEAQKNDPQFFNRFTRSDKFGLVPNDIDTFGHLWTKLLREKAVAENKG
jgi:glycosyltransferase involved in cell wall biosynthesis